MNSEYEVRVLDIDVDSFIKQIEKLGAIYVNKYEQKKLKLRYRILKRQMKF